MDYKATGSNLVLGSATFSRQVTAVIYEKTLSARLRRIEYEGLKQLRNKNRILRIENDIFYKVSAYFAKKMW